MKVWAGYGQRYGHPPSRYGQAKPLLPNPPTHKNTQFPISLSHKNVIDTNDTILVKIQP